MSEPIRKLMEEAKGMKDDDVTIVLEFLVIIKHRRNSSMINPLLVETLINQVQNYHKVLMEELSQREPRPLSVIEKEKEGDVEEKLLN